MNPCGIGYRCRDFGTIEFGEAVPLSWDMATTPGEALEDLETDDDFFGFSVETGCGTLADTEAVQALWRWDFDRREAVYGRDEDGKITSFVTDFTLFEN